MGYSGKIEIVRNGANPESIKPTFDPKEVDSLCDIIVSISKGDALIETKILVSDHIKEVLQLIDR